jgi:acyl-coenzyme A synthetase/AMP-(fatty) acid ligase
MMAAIQESNFNFRSQLVPHIIDHYAKVKPDAIYAEYPKSPLSYENGYRPITFRALANAINGVAWWLTEKLGPGNGEILPYVGPNDVRYPALILGAVKAGYCVSEPIFIIIANHRLTL